MSDTVHRIGIDLGGTKIESICLADKVEIFRKRIPTPRSEGYDAILHAIVGLIKETQSSTKIQSPATVGIGIPGFVDLETNLVKNANTTLLIGKPLQKDLENELGYSIVVENDANCFALAEATMGSAQGYDLVFGIIMGTGCGGGLSINGKVRRGKNGICGEWGHLSIDPQGQTCFCGNKGCVETKISGSGVERQFLEKYKRSLRMQEIVDGYAAGQNDCVEVMNQFFEDFGRSLGGLLSILDPDAVVIGGGLSHIDELYTIGIQKAKQYAFHHDLKTPILKNSLGDSAGVFGAAFVGSGVPLL